MNIVKFINAIVVVCCGFLTAQLTDHSRADSLERQLYEIIYPQVSPNERYITFNKQDETSSDSMVLLDRKKAGQVIFRSGGLHASRLKFTKSSNLFMKEKNSAKLLQLPSQKLLVWKDVTEALYTNKFNQIILLQNDSLKILNEMGKEIRIIPNVVRLKKFKEDIFYTLRDQENYTISLWEGGYGKTIYTSNSISGEIIYSDSLGNSIWEENYSNKKNKLFFKPADKEIAMQFPDELADYWYSVDVSSMENGNYFVKMITDAKNQTDKNEVEIWYGNDPKIQTKFFAPHTKSSFIWNPTRNQFSTVHDKNLSEFFFIGNSKYLISFDPYEEPDYIKKFKSFHLHRYNIDTKKFDFLLNVGILAFTDPNGKYILSHAEHGFWNLFNIETMVSVKIQVPDREMAYFSLDGKYILFEGIGSMHRYHITDKSLEKIYFKKDFTAKVENGTKHTVTPPFSIFQYSYDQNQPVIVNLYDKNNIQNGISSYDGKSVKEILKPTVDDITSITWTPNYKMHLYVRSNINTPPQLIMKKDENVELLYSSNKNDHEAKTIKHTVISYRNSRDIALKGVLLYPIGYDPTKKYPMVVPLYQKLRFTMNKYLLDGTGMMAPTEGINVRTLLRKGYFVYMPDIVFDERGTGIAALDCVHSAMDALKNYTAIDFKKVAVVGHSHGGYETNFIATQSDRFATYISGAGNSDLVRSYHSFNYNFLRPFYWQFENGQYEMPGQFSQFKSVYIENSPIYHAEKVNRPILLWTGQEDKNIFWEQTMEFYLGLRRNNKWVTALFYPKEGHSLIKQKNRLDLYSKIYDWLDHHLKNNKKDWINKMN